MREPNDNMRMAINPRRSFFTLLLLSFVVEFSCGSAFADQNTETVRLESELSAARNALDAEILKKGRNPKDAAIQEKTAAVEAGQKALKHHFQNSVTRSGSAGSSSAADNSTPSEPSEARSAPEPQTVLSGKDIQGEIRYSKKSKKKPAASLKESDGVTDPAASTENDATLLPNPASGQSEIQYPKKSTKKLKAN